MTESKRDAEERRLDAEDEYELEDAESGEDLDTAMREALRAVERSDAEADPQDSEDAAASEPTAPAAPEAEVAALEAQLAETRDRHVRTLADFDNFRKRVERERLEARRYAGFEILSELLPILDNLQLAIDSPGGVDDLKAGVDLILRQFEELLRSHGVERIPAVGRPFDPTLHDAVSREEDEAAEQPTVGEELRAGYRMGERLLRPASVRVKVPPRDSETEEGEGPAPSETG